MQKYINEIIRPKIQGDGGEITFVSMDNDIITVSMQGECSKCLILDRCINWIESQIKTEFGKEIKINAVRNKPFFWDK